jgi:thymidylate synthase
MLHLTFNDVNAAYCEMQTIKHNFANWETTRNGRALVFDSPVGLTHTHPERRVLFDPVRDANPFFHYMEAIWMLAGKNHTRFPVQFAANLAQYSDDGKVFHGAYGHRWRNNWDVDQIDEVIAMLKKDPTTRRCVIAMWDPAADLGTDSKDLPCNTHLYFRVTDVNRLNMTVCNRSNDLVWGMLGANIVHFSILQEYIAAAAGLELGKLYQISNNVHVYDGWEDRFSRADSRWYTMNPGYRRTVFSPATFNLKEVDEFVWNGLDTDMEYTCAILDNNAVPMLKAWMAYKSGDVQEALNESAFIMDDDWREACNWWLNRRLLK